jgi:hypothetical protein
MEHAVSSSSIRLRRASVLALSLVLIAVTPTPIPAQATDNPCSGISRNPASKPRDEPAPTIGGTVMNVSRSEPISGATMNLYKCVLGSGSLVDSTSTDAYGDYEFGSLVWAYYYVEASLTGPLYGMTPASGYANPTAVIGVGDGDPNVDLAFQ